ncbi:MULTISPECIES: hypothetical protein [unclassified Streptomyces]|uniref:hypothetical protein n=1 Tax=unclassified Streptomyces TaxID=2593676 RepID=UPI00278C72DA|nr:MULTISPECIES: hypothetical protein [unclassified Streptomyces]
MNSAVIGLVAAVVGVTGTLLAPIFSQRLLARSQADQFDQQQAALRTQWLREQERLELTERRGCYITTSAAYWRYRVQLMNYLWHVHREDLTPDARAELDEARRAHHSAFAEAQLIASAVVLAHLDSMAIALGDAYRKIKFLEEGAPRSNGAFEDIEGELQQLWDPWQEMRRVMRVDLGASHSPVR